jgi:ribosomal-protein-alanine N-acetyltransferase
MLSIEGPVASNMESVLQFLLEIGADPVTEESVLSFSAKEGCLLLFAFVESKAVGWIRAYVLPEIELLGPMMLLFEIDVLEAHRRQGVAKALVEELKRLAKERDCREVWVVTEDDNEPARKLYESTGLQCRTIPDRMYWCDL